MNYYIEDDEPVTFRKLKKIVPDGNNGWEERIFYSTSENVVEARKWLNDVYGEAKYSQSWWSVSTHVVMSEKIYTHYKLCV
jgi:hypothetical protein